jgi:hypothetical protein
MARILGALLLVTLSGVAIWKAQEAQRKRDDAKTRHEQAGRETWKADAEEMARRDRALSPPDPWRKDSQHSGKPLPLTQRPRSRDDGRLPALPKPAAQAPCIWSGSSVPACAFASAVAPAAAAAAEPAPVAAAAPAVATEPVSAEAAAIAEPVPADQSAQRAPAPQFVARPPPPNNSYRPPAPSTAPPTNVSHGPPPASPPSRPVQPPPEGRPRPPTIKGTWDGR